MISTSHEYNFQLFCYLEEKLSIMEFWHNAVFKRRRVMEYSLRAVNNAPPVPWSVSPALAITINLF